MSFMYSDVIDDADIDARLYVASERYGVKSLQGRCESNLCDKINVSNVAELYRLAYLHEASRSN